MIKVTNTGREISEEEAVFPYPTLNSVKLVLRSLVPYLLPQLTPIQKSNHRKCPWIPLPPITKYPQGKI